MIRPCFFQKKRIFSKVCILANQTQKTLWRGVGHFWTVQEAQISSRSETKGYLPSQYTQILVVDTFGPNLKNFTEKSCHNTLKVVIVKTDLEKNNVYHHCLVKDHQPALEME